MSFFDVSQLGFWALALLILVSVFNLVASLALTGKRKTLERKATDLSKRPDFNTADMAWLVVELETATDRWFWWTIALAAPALVFNTVVESFRGETVQQEGHGSTPSPDRTLEAELIERVTKVRPDTGAYWGSKEQKEIEDLASSIQTFMSPIPIIWVGLWFVLFSPVIGLAYLLGGHGRKFPDFLRSTVGSPSQLLSRWRIAFAR